MTKEPALVGQRQAQGQRIALGSVHLHLRMRPLLWTVLLLAVVLLIGATILATGRLAITPADLIRILFAPDGSAASNIVHNLRVPRVATGAATGAALGVSGLLFQSLSRNALGSPEIIGIVSGAALGAVVGVVLLGTHAWGTAACAVIGCLTATTVGLALTSGRGYSVSRLLLVGVGLSAFWGSITTLLLTSADAELGVTAQLWLVGTLNARTWEHALVALIALLLLVPFALVLARHLAVLELGLDLAAGLGASLKRMTLMTGLVGVGLTAAAVAATGPISFVALAAPHLARSLGGHTLPPVILSALTGAALLLTSEWLLVLLPFGAQAPVGIATSVLGGGYLVFVILRSAR